MKSRINMNPMKARKAAFSELGGEEGRGPREACITGKWKRKSEFTGVANIKSTNTGSNCEVNSATVVRKPAWLNQSN